MIHLLTVSKLECKATYHKPLSPLLFMHSWLFMAITNNWGSIITTSERGEIQTLVRLI